MTQPQTHIAGDTLIFTETLANYSPTDGWVAKWHVLGKNKFSYDGAADGTSFTWTISASNTAKWPPEHYRTFIRVTNGDETHTLNESVIDITANPDTPGAAYESRSHWRIVKENLETVIQNHSTKGYETLTVQMPNGSMRAVTNMKWADILTAYSHAKRMVAREESEQGIQKGIGRGKIVTRFDSVSQ